MRPNTRFQFNRGRSKSDSPSSQRRPHRKSGPLKNGRGHAIHRSLLIPHHDAHGAVYSEPEDTDVEDMFHDHPPPLTESITAGGIPSITAGASLEEVKMKEADSYERRDTVQVNGTPSNRLEVTDHTDHESLLSEDGMFTPRALGTDAFSRIRSKSIASRLSAQSGYQGDECKTTESTIDGRTRGRRNTAAEKRRRGVCPFWNPFESPPHCPYTTVTAVGGPPECGLTHMNKTEYLENSSEEELVELIQVLFCQSLPVEACSVIEKLLSTSPDNDEYNCCMSFHAPCSMQVNVRQLSLILPQGMGDVLEELGRYTDSERFYQRALALNPEYADVHNNYGVMLYTDEHSMDLVSDP